jgi:type IV secretory pathway protease TraF
VVYQSCETAAEPLDRDLEGTRRCPSGSDPGEDSKAISFVVQSHFLIDNRCFGPAGEWQIIGVARPLRTWNPPE